MRYVYTENPDVVICIDTGTVIPRGNYLWPEDDSTIDPAPRPTFDDYVARFTPGLQAWMEQVAHSNAYDSVLSCVSYKDSGVVQFAGDAAAMIAWRDAVWRWASAWQAGFNGHLPENIPTLEEVIALAPQPDTFGWVVHEPGTIIESQLPPVADA